MDMEPMDMIRDKFSQDCTVETVLQLLMSHFDMSEEQAQAEIDTYFRIVDMGPGGGKLGGQIIAAGTPDEIRRNDQSVTGQYL